MKFKSIKINAFLNSLRSVLNIIFPLITFPYVSRVLSVNGMGIYNFSSTFIGYFTLVAGLGIYTYAIREGSKYRDNCQKISEFSSQVLSINVVSTLISYILLFIIIILFKSLHHYALCIIIFSSEIFFSTFGIEWLYTIYEDYSYITIRSIIFKIVSVVLLFAFVRNSGDYLIYAGITVLASVGSNILNYIHSKTFITIRLTRKIDWKKHLKPILTIFAAAVAVNIYVYSDNTILGLMRGDYSVGIYSVAVKIYTIAQSLITAILMVTIPRLSFLLGKKQMDQYNLLLKKVINTLILLVLPAATGLVMLSKDIVLLIAGNKYMNSVTSLEIIAWAIIFSIFNWIFSDCVLIPAKRERLVLISTLITAAFNVILNVVLIPFFSYNAPAFSTVVSELLAMVIDGYFSRDIIVHIIFSKSFIKNIFDAVIGCLVIVAVCVFVNYLISSSILNLFTAFLISILAYGLVMLLLKNQLIFSFIKAYL